MAKVFPGDSAYGSAKTHDPEFKGPIQGRGCTDIICCILYIAFLGGLGVVAYFAFIAGDPIRLLSPTDSQGNICDYDNIETKQNLTGKPYLFYYDISRCASLGSSFGFQCPTKQICVDKCPDQYWVFLQNPLFANSEAMHKYCEYGYTPPTFTAPNAADALKVITDEKCPPYILKSKPFLNRCIPSLVQDVVHEGANVLDNGEITIDTGALNVPSGSDGSTELAVDLSALKTGIATIGEYVDIQDIGGKVLDDFIETWPWMLGLLVLAMIISFLVIVLMRWIAGPIIWFLVFALIAGLGVGLWYTTDRYMRLTDIAMTWAWVTNVSYYTQTQEFWLAIAIIDGIILIIILLLVICLCRRIRLAIKLIEQASRAVGCMMSTLFLPLAFYLLQLLNLIVFTAIAIYLASNGEPYYNVFSSTESRNGTSCVPKDFVAQTANEKCIFVSYGGDPNIFRLQIYNLFALFWNANFIIGLGQVTLAGAFASWYWAFNKSTDVPLFPLAASFWRALRYHLGSIAFGALIIAIIQIIRAALEYVERKLKKSDNKVAEFAIKCLRCCFWCLEKIIRFVTRNAYIMIAIHGKNFCFSAKDAFSLLLRNILRVSVLNGVTTFLLVIAKLFVVGVTAFISFLAFTGDIQIPYFLLSVGSLNYYWVPIIVIIIGTYIIADLFFDVYDMAIDTIFLSFLEDCERNDGSPEKPYFMPKDLMKLVGKENTFHSLNEKA